jgi:hypothetical protein
MGKQDKEVEQLRAQLNTFQSSMWDYIQATQAAMASMVEQIVNYKEVFVLLNDRINAVEPILGSLSDGLQAAHNVCKIHHDTIAELIERVSKLDGGDRPDLGDFGGRFSGLN